MNNRFLNKKFWLDIFFPNRCPSCQKVIVWNELVCKDCMDELYFSDDPFSASEKITKNSMVNICTVFRYKGNAVPAIYNLKLRKMFNLAEMSAEYFAESLSNEGILDRIDAVTFVPMSRKKKRGRGYNQSEKFAEIVAKRLGKPIIKNLILHKDTLIEQHKLTYIQRQENVSKVYEIHPEHSDISGKTLLLCDDVITTGATMNQCAGLLVSMGAKSVYGAAICNTELD